ncbi:MAG: alanine dehydrogenase [Patescibacteria group bacterium]|nr:alanine dehydrogenase [Patescibacteria group bacterium]
MAGYIVGTIKEIKDNENRVGLTPKGVAELTGRGVRVLVQKSAGVGSGFMDNEYKEAGAEMLDTPEEVVKQIDILVKVKEPIESEYRLLELMRGKILYTYLHLSGVAKSLTEKLLECEITGIAYETIFDANGKLPCLAPMSEVAGVLAVQYGAQYLQKKYNGRGLTLGPVRNADKAHTVIVGGGVVGTKAAEVAAGMGGKVTIFDINPKRVEELKKELHEYLGDNLYASVNVLKSEPGNFERAVKDADLLIGGVLVAGAKAPTVVSENMVKSMKKGAVIVDVAIDQGGCIWGSKATTHSNPTYEIDGKIFCCVANMPGQASRQSTQALTTSTLPYLLSMCEKGVDGAMKADEGFAKGLNTACGKIVYKAVAEDREMMDHYMPVEEFLGEGCGTSCENCACCG